MKWTEHERKPAMPGPRCNTSLKAVPPLLEMCKRNARPLELVGQRGTQLPSAEEELDSKKLDRLTDLDLFKEKDHEYP